MLERWLAVLALLMVGFVQSSDAQKFEICNSSDLNKDGVVDFQDFLIFSNNFGKTGEPCPLLIVARDTTYITFRDTIYKTKVETVRVESPNFNPPQLPPVQIPTSNIVNIPDPNLRRELELLFRKESGEDITVEDMKDIPSNLEYRGQYRPGLSLYERGIRSVEGLQYATNLEVLDLSRNNISDISQLGYLTELKKLELVGNDIYNINALSHLRNLTHLSFSGEQITDLTPLTNLEEMYSLAISQVRVSDIFPLRNMTGLVFLTIQCTKRLEDISLLANFKSLVHLSLSDNRIFDISPLEGLTKLSYLNLSYNNIQDISPLWRNKGIGSSEYGNTDHVSIVENPLSDRSRNHWIPKLLELKNPSGRLGVSIHWRIDQSPSSSYKCDD